MTDDEILAFSSSLDGAVFSGQDEDLEKKKKEQEEQERKQKEEEEEKAKQAALKEKKLDKLPEMDDYSAMLAYT